MFVKARARTLAKAFMMILQIFRGHDRHRQYLDRTALCSTIVLISMRFQNIVNYYIGRYNIGVVHVVSSFHGYVAIPIVTNSA